MSPTAPPGRDPGPITGLVLCLILAVGAPPRALAAQLPSPDPAALGTGSPSPALARGYGAVAVNPAALAASDAPAFSVTALSVGVASGLDPVTLGDLADWEGRELPRPIRLAWLRDVVNRGSEAGAAGADVTVVAASRGRLGFQLSTRASGRLDLNPDAAELVLFGNAGLDGTPRDFDLAGSSGDGWIVTTGGLAYGWPAGRLAGGSLHLGATLTYSVGHALVVARDNGSGLGGDPTELDLRFPVLHVEDGAGLDHGRGGGLDVGALWIGRRVTVGATVRNLVHTFAWRTVGLSFRPGQAFFDADDSGSDFDPRPAEEAPPILLDALEGLGFRRALAVGAAWDARSRWTLTGDLRWRENGGMTPEPDALLGVGMEYRPRQHVPLRAGVAVVERGIQLSAGAGLGFGRLTVSGAVAMRAGALDDVVLGTLGVSFRNPS